MLEYCGNYIVSALKRTKITAKLFNNLLIIHVIIDYGLQKTDEIFQQTV